MSRYLCFLVLLFFASGALRAQCFTTSGNPVGGTTNMGVMDKNTLRMTLFYRFSCSDQYFLGNKKYSGNQGVLQKASYNYLGLLSGYGLTDRLTVEAEAGYYINKTQLYYIEDTELTGRGLSNLVISLKPQLYHHPDKRFEVSCALGANIPFSTEMQQVQGVTLPINIQPSIGSYGLVFQSFLVKENSFRATRFFWVGRVEKYFKNPQDYEPGTLYMNSFFFSKHFTFEQWRLKDWTFILQLRNQIKKQDTRSDQIIGASGNFLLFLIPQVNLTIGEHWNVSALIDIPVYRYYNGIQLANRSSFVLTLIRDFHV